jgi:hypothetical protein
MTAENGLPQGIPSVMRGSNIIRALAPAQIVNDRREKIYLANGNRFVIPAGFTTGTDLIVETGQPRRRPVPPPPPAAVADSPGCDLRPDPSQAATPAELIMALDDFRVWAGDRSYRAMAIQASQLVSAATLQRALTGTALPSQKAVIAVITGCGGSDQDKRRFVSAWRRIRMARSVGSAVSPGCVLRVVPATETG